MKITDQNGEEIEVTDLRLAIAQADSFRHYSHKDPAHRKQVPSPESLLAGLLRKVIAAAKWPGEDRVIPSLRRQALGLPHLYFYPKRKQCACLHTRGQSKLQPFWLRVPFFFLLFPLHIGTGPVVLQTVFFAFLMLSCS